MVLTTKYEKQWQFGVRDLPSTLTEASQTFGRFKHSRKKFIVRMAMFAMVISRGSLLAMSSLPIS